MKSRVKKRVAFGKPLVEQGTIQQDIALSRSASLFGSIEKNLSP
jgi:hypothetical protein